jgi:hypothetical protein
VVLGVVQFVVAIGLRDLLTLGAVAPGAEPETLAELFDVRVLVALGVVAVLSFLATPVVSGAVTWLAVHAHLGRPRSWTEAYRAVLRRLGGLVGSMLLTLLLGLAALVAVAIVVGVPAVLVGQASLVAGVLLGVLGGLVLGLPAYVVVLAIGYLAIPAVVVEGRSAAGAVGRSARLLRAGGLRGIGLVVLAGLLVGTIQGAVGGTVGAVGAVGGSLAWLLTAIGGAVGQAVAVPAAAVLGLLIHVDLRARSEGIDPAGLGDRLPPA